jgi:hypothetical protein
MVKITKLQALKEAAWYIIHCESGEYESYVTYCEDNGYNPKNIQGKDQRLHAYALALIGLGMAFPKGDSDDSTL